MSQQIQISGGAKVRDLQDVIIGTSGVLSSLAFDVANGVPKLDSNGKILVSQLPNSVMEYKGTWNAATNTPTLANGTGNQGDVYLCNVAGTVNFGAGPIAFFVGDQVIYSGSIWQRASGATGTVTSVAITESGDSLNITGSPITTSGTINIGFNGTNLQYVNGAGNLTTFPILTGYVTAVSGTAPVVSSGGTTPAISMAAATGSVDGYLSATDFAIFNAKQSALTFSSPLVNTSGTISIPAATTSVNGYLASADFTTFNNKQNAITLTTTGTSGASTLVGATLNIPQYTDAYTGTVTSVAALTIGTTGTDLSSSVANSTTTPVITLNVPTASATNRGALSSADWTTFNNKQSALTNPVLASGTWTSGYLPKINGTYTIGNSLLQEGTNAIGLGVTPSAWSGVKALQIGNGSLVATGNFVAINSNSFFDGVDKYISNSFASQYYQLSGQHVWQTAPSGTAGNLITFTQAMILNASGNLGLGVTPSAWSTLKALQISSQSSLSADGTSTQLSTNAFFDGGWKYIQTDEATNYYQLNGQHVWRQAISGSAGAAITFTQAMTLFATGNLAINSTTDNGNRLQVTGNIRLDASATNWAYYINGGAGGWARGYRFMGNAGTAFGGLWANGSDDTTNYYTIGSAFNAGLTVHHSSSNVTIGTTTDSGYKLDVNGTARVQGALTGTSATFSGNVGINTTSLVVPLTVRGTTDRNLEVSGSGGVLLISSIDNARTLYKNFGIDGSALFLQSQSGGNVGIGTTSPAYKLDVSGTGNFTGALSGTSASFSSTATATAFIPSSATVPTNGMYLSAANTLNFATASTNRLTINSSGNLGLGVTPSAWMSGTTALQVIRGSLWHDNSNYFAMPNNGYYNGSNWIYINTAFATNYAQVNGSHQWFNAPSGTAGNAITFTQAMTLFANGGLALGTITPTTSAGYTTFSTNGSTGGQIEFQTAAVGKAFIYSNSTDLRFYTGGGAFRFENTTGLEVGYSAAIGLYKLDVNGTGRFSGNINIGTVANSGNYSINVFGNDNRIATQDNNNGTSGIFMRVLSSGTQVGNATIRVNNAGSLAIFTGTTSEAIALTIASTGAATFSSTITATAGIFSTITSITNGDQSGARLTIANTGTGGQSINLIAGNPNVDNTGFSIAYGNTNMLRFATSGAATFLYGVTANAGLEMGGQVLAFNQSGTRSWSVQATGGNLRFQSGDNLGAFSFGSNVLIGTTDDGGRVVSYTTTAATQFKAAGTAPAITFSNTVLSPTIGGVLGVCTAASQFFTGTASSDMVLANQFSAGDLIFGTNNLARMRVKASGVINITSIPTSSVGLVAGDIYSNAGILTIV